MWTVSTQILSFIPSSKQSYICLLESAMIGSVLQMTICLPRTFYHYLYDDTEISCEQSVLFLEWSVYLLQCNDWF